MISRQNTSEQYIELNTGQVLWLDDPGKVWQVEGGQVDVFAVTGERRRQYRQVFLGQAGEGRLLFGLPRDEAGGVRLMVTAAQPATIAMLSRTELAGQVQGDAGPAPATLRVMLEEWLATLLAGLELQVAPRSFVPLVPGETATLAAGETVRAGAATVWMSVETGAASYGAMPAGSIPLAVAVPLPAQGWLTAETAATVRGLAAEEVFPLAGLSNPAEFWQPLDHCHALFVKLMLSWFDGADRRDGERLAAGKQLRQRLLHGAAYQLVRTDLPELAPVAVIDGTLSPLVVAMRAAAVHLGVAVQRVRLPAGADPARQDPAMLRSIAQLAGMQVRQVRLETGWQRRDNGPLIGFHGSRPVALLPASPEKYRLFDPGSEESVAVDEEAAGMIDANAYAIFAALPGKTSGVAGLLRFMLGKCWPGDLWNILLVSLVAGLIPMLTPLVTQSIFEDIIPVTDRQGLVMVVQVMLVAAFATAGVNFARGVTVLRLKNRSRLVAESALWLRLLALPAAFFRRYEAGDLAQRMYSVTQVSMMLSNSVMTALFNALFSFGSLLVMLYYSWKLTFAAAAVWLVYLAVTGWLEWRMVAAKRKMMAAAGETSGQVLQIINGLGKIRVQGAEAQAFYLWASRFGEQWKWDRDFRWQSNWLELANALQPVLLTMAIFWLTMSWLAPGSADGQSITLPQFMGFNAALTGFNVTLTGLVSQSAGLLEIVPIIERLRPVLEAEPEVTEDKAEAGELSGRLEINNVSFRYRPELPFVLHNVSILVQPGQFVAIVGASGSGKSSLLRLLLGFEKPEIGAVYYDRQDLAELNVASIRSQIGVVLQNGQLMAGDVLTNIIGSLPLTIDDAWQAAEMVGLADDIRAMPMGMHTFISEGAANISGGQRQRILIARAIIHRPRIIMFDEATSALDNRTQAIVTESLGRLKATRIVVAHRLSTVMNADVIYVMDKGVVVEQGTYGELVAKNGLFATLAKRQMA